MLSIQYRVHEELQHHVYEMVVESGKEKPLSVVIDNDTSAITENVIRYSTYNTYKTCTCSVCSEDHTWVWLCLTVIFRKTKRAMALIFAMRLHVM